MHTSTNFSQLTSVQWETLLTQDPSTISTVITLHTEGTTEPLDQLNTFRPHRKSVATHYHTSTYYYP